MANAQIFHRERHHVKPPRHAHLACLEFSGSVMFYTFSLPFALSFEPFCLNLRAQLRALRHFVSSLLRRFFSSVSSMFSSITKHANLPPFSRIFFLVFLLKNPVHPYFNSSSSLRAFALVWRVLFHEARVFGGCTFSSPMPFDASLLPIR